MLQPLNTTIIFKEMITKKKKIIIVEGICQLNLLNRITIEGKKKKFITNKRKGTPCWMGWIALEQIY